MLQFDYTPTKPGMIPAADPTNGADNMNKNKNIKPYIIDYVLERLLEERAEHPEHFLLTTRESEFLNKAGNCFLEARAAYITPLDLKAIPQEVYQAIANKTIDLLNEKKISIEKLKKIIDKKYKNTFFWTIAAEIIQKEDKNGLLIEAATNKLVIITSDSESKIYIDYDDSNNGFIRADSMPERLAALGLSDLYLYVSRYELEHLKAFCSLFDLLAEIKAADDTPAKIDTSKFWPMVSTPVLNAYDSIGANARKPEIKKERNEKGQQIHIAEFSSNSNIKIQLADFTPDNGGLISVGDPNTDKLLKQMQIKSIQTGQKEGVISIDEFMDFRNLSDRKSAILAADKAADNLDRTRLHIDETTPDYMLKGNIRYVQKSFLITRPGRAGSVIYYQFTDDIFNHIMKLSSRGQQIEQFDKKIAMLPNNQHTAYNIACKLSHHVRINAGGRNDHKIGVKSLIDSCVILPLYPEDSAEAGKANYLRYPSEAPEKIIKPFMNGLNYITKGYQTKSEYQILERYTFKRQRGGAALTDSELSEALKDYKKFILLIIEFEFCNEPNYTNVIEGRAKYKEKAAETKEKQTKPKRKSKKKTATAEPGKAESNQQAEPIQPKTDYFEDL